MFIVIVIVIVIVIMFIVIFVFVFVCGSVVHRIFVVIESNQVGVCGGLPPPEQIVGLPRLEEGRRDEGTKAAVIAFDGPEPQNVVIAVAIAVAIAIVIVIAIILRGTIVGGSCSYDTGALVGVVVHLSLQEGGWAVGHIGEVFIPLAPVVDRPIVRKQVDKGATPTIAIAIAIAIATIIVIATFIAIANTSAGQRPVPAVEVLGRLVVDNVSRLHGDFVQAIRVVKDLDGPRVFEIVLGNVDNEADRVRGEPVDVAQETGALLVLAQSVHTGFLDLDAGPVAHQFPETGLPLDLGVPGDCHELDVGFPPIDKDALPLPFFVDDIVSIVVIKGGHVGKDVVRESSLGKSERAKGPIDHLVFAPFHVEGLFDGAFDLVDPVESLGRRGRGRPKGRRGGVFDGDFFIKATFLVDNLELVSREGKKTPRRSLGIVQIELLGPRTVVFGIDPKDLEWPFADRVVDETGLHSAAVGHEPVVELGFFPKSGGRGGFQFGSVMKMGHGVARHPSVRSFFEARRHASIVDWFFVIVVIVLFVIIVIIIIISIVIVLPTEIGFAGPVVRKDFGKGLPSKGVGFKAVSRIDLPGFPLVGRTIRPIRRKDDVVANQFVVEWVKVQIVLNGRDHLYGCVVFVFVVFLFILFVFDPFRTAKHE